VLQQTGANDERWHPNPSRHYQRAIRKWRGWTVAIVTLLLWHSWPTASLWAQAATSCPGYYLSPQQRIGINVAREAGKEITDYAVEQLGLGWYLDYTRHEEPAHPPTTAPPGQMAYMPMIRPSHFQAARQAGTLPSTLTETLAVAVANNPGATWLVGNEPDNREQDNLTADAYAMFYHIVYEVIKGLDAGAQIAIAPITAVTPLRLRYLDAVLAAYQSRYGAPMPVDIWTVHVYILPEGYEENPTTALEDTIDNEASNAQGVGHSWGIGIPPGLEAYATEALTFTQEEHDDLHLFTEQISQMRTWLAKRGYREKPLYLTEYGILLSPDHGFDERRVEVFLLGSMAWLQGARNIATGFPADDNRLVQRWAWFSLNFYAFDPTPDNEYGLAGMNGNLFDHGSGTMTAVGEQFKTYMDRLQSRTVDLAFVTDETPNPLSAYATATSTVTIVNRGDALADGFRLRLFWGKIALGTLTIQAPLLPHCGNQIEIPLRWGVQPAAGATTLHLQLLPAPGQVEIDLSDNRATWLADQR